MKLYYVTYILDDAKPNHVYVIGRSKCRVFELVLDSFDNAGDLEILSISRIQTLNDIVRDYWDK
jgi:hypothetical protein